MKHYFLALIFLLSCCCLRLQAQLNHCPETWEQHLSTSSLSGIVCSGDTVWTTANIAGLVYYNKRTGETASYNYTNSNVELGGMMSLAKHGGYYYLWSLTEGFLKFSSSDNSFEKLGDFGLAGEGVFDIYPLDNGGFLLGTGKGVLQIYPDQSSILYDGNNSPIAGKVFCAMENTNGIWLGGDDGLFQLENNAWTSFFQGETVQAIEKDANANIWVAASNGLHKRDVSGNWVSYTADNSGLPSNEVTALAMEGGAVVWGRTLSNTFFRFDGLQFQIYDETNTSGHPYLLENDIYTVLEIDENGQAWTGAQYGHGLSSLSANSWQQYQLSPVTSMGAGRMAKDSSGNVWSAFPELVRWSADGYDCFDAAEYPWGNKQVFSIAGAKIGGILVGGDDFLAYFNGQDWLSVSSDYLGFPLGIVVEITEGENGDIWLATTTGLVYKTNNVWGKYDSNNSHLPEDDIKSVALFRGLPLVATQHELLYLDGLKDTVFFTTEATIRQVLPSKDRYHIATDEGLYEFVFFSHFLYNTDNSGLIDNNVFRLAKEENGALWVGTGSGLSRYFEEEWTSFDTNNTTLPANPIFEILTDGDRKLVGTLYGMSILEDSYAAFSNRKSCDFDHQLNNTSRGLDNFSWYVEGDFVSNDFNLSHVFPDTGSYEVELVGYDGGNCMSSFTRTVEIGPRVEELSLVDTLVVWADSVEFEAMPGYAYYFWYSQVSPNVLEGTGRKVTFRESGDYSLWIWDNCDGVTAQKITVELLGEPVFPGDLNSDGEVDIYDIQVFNFAYGKNGPTRSDTSGWGPQVADPWPESLPSGINMKHCDANGDGLVDEQDLQLVDQNYGKTHAYSSSVPFNNFGEPDNIQLSFNDSTVLKLTDTTKTTIFRLRLEGNGLSVGGASFYLKHNQTNACFYPADSSFLLDANNPVVFTKDLPNERLAIGLSRTDEQSRDVNGFIGYLIIEELDIVAVDPDEVDISVGEGNAMNHLGDTVSIVDFKDDGIPMINMSKGKLGLKLKLWLEGAYDAQTGLMRNLLERKKLLPREFTTENGFPKLGAMGITDFIEIELRAAESPSLLVYKQTACLLQDGQVINLDGFPELDFPGLKPGYYYCLVRHRNHLAAMSAVPIWLGEGQCSYDFSQKDSYKGPFGQVLMDGKWMLIAGATNQDAQISKEDHTIFTQMNGMFNNYLQADFNLDGDVNGLDCVLWLKNEGKQGVQF